MNEPGPGLGRQALAEMWERDEQLGIDPRSPSRVIVEAQPKPSAPSLVVEPPDWEAERVEALEREREQQRIERERIAAEELARVRQAAAELEAAQAPEKPTLPAQKHRSWRRTPA